MKTLLAAVLATLFLVPMLSGCLTTGALKGEPPMAVYSGKARTVAFVMYSEDPEIEAFARDKLQDCLAARKVFVFVGNADVKRAVASAPDKPSNAFGMSREAYAKIAADAGAELVLHGNLRIVKALKFTGWRQDVYSMFYLHNVRGENVDTWRSDAIGTFTDAKSELDPYAMVGSAINHTCEKIVEQMAY